MNGSPSPSWALFSLQSFLASYTCGNRPRSSRSQVFPVNYQPARLSSCGLPGCWPWGAVSYQARPGITLLLYIYTIWYKIYDTMTLNEWSWIQEYYNALMHHLPPYEFQHCSLQGECWPQTREAGLPFQIQIRLFHCKPDYSTCSFPPLVAHSTEGTCTIGCW